MDGLSYVATSNLASVSSLLISTAALRRESRAFGSTTTPGVVASTSYRAERNDGLTSGFQSMSVASEKTRFSTFPSAATVAAFFATATGAAFIATATGAALIGTTTEFLK